MKQYAKALHYQQKIDNVLKKLSTSADGNMAALSMQAGNYEKAVEIQEKAVPQNKSEFILTYQSTVELSFNMGEYSKAFESMKNTFQPIHPNFGMYHKNMALLYYDMKQYSKARQHFEKVLDLIQKLFPSNYVELLVYSSRICEIYIEMSDSFKAQTTFQQCMRIEQLAAAINMQTYGWEDYIVQ